MNTITQCPVCGRAFTTMESLLADQNPGFQCHHCWNRVRKPQMEPRRVSASSQRKPHGTARGRILTRS